MKFSLATILATVVVSAQAQLKDIPTTAIDNGSFTTLVAALGVAELVTPLSGDGPFTVFAPTDDAFIALPNGLVECLLEPGNVHALKDILLYHVASGDVPSTDLSDGQLIETLNGDKVEVDIDSGEVLINDSKVIIADVRSTNGVIHVIDQVLIPPKFSACGVGGGDESDSATCTYLGVTRLAGEYLTGPTHICLCTRSGRWTNCRLNNNNVKTIEQVIVDSNQLSTLEAVVRKAGTLGVLDGPGPFTLFAPSNRAFAKVPEKLLNFLLDDANESVLADVLKYHVYSGEATTSDLALGSSAVPSLLGGVDDITVEKTCWSAVETCSDVFSIVLNDSSYVVAADIDTSNGIIHVIEEVLIPPSLASAVAGILA